MKHALLACCLLIPSLAVRAADIQTLLDDAVAKGEKRIVIPPGEHRLDEALKIKDLSGVEIVGEEALLVFTNVRDGGLAIADCENLTLRGFTIDFDPLPFTQGVIESVDAEKGVVRYTVHEGYPDLTADYVSHRAHIFTPDTRVWKPSAPDIYASSGRALTPRRGELVFARDRRWQLAHVAPGDLIVQDIRRERGVRIDRCSDITVEGVTIWSAPGIAMTVRFVDGENRFSFRVGRGPTPPGATEPRLLSTSADAFNYAYARTGLVLENCDFSFMGDDSVNLHGIAFAVAESEGSTLRLIRPYGHEAFDKVIRPGDEVRGIAQGNFDITGSSTVVSVARESSPDPRFVELLPTLFPHVRGERFSIYRLELTAPLALAAGDFVEIPAIAAAGYTIRNNRFGHHRGRALRLMSSRGLVENNHIEGVKQAAITLGPEFVGFREAGWVENVVLRGNTILDSCFDPGLVRHASYTPGAISVMHRGETPDAPRPVVARHRNITIENNRIENVGGPAIHINQAAGVRIVNNRISRANQAPAAANNNRYGLTTDRPIGIDASEDVLVVPGE
jgi:hypothetical protein